MAIPEGGVQFEALNGHRRPGRGHTVEAATVISVIRSVPLLGACVEIEFQDITVTVPEATLATARAGVSLPALLAVLVPVSISTIDISLTNTALPTIAREIGAASATSIWVVNAYYLVVVAALLPFAALGEIYGHRRVFGAGIAVFMAGSLACGLVSSLPTLVGARTLLGLGAAAIAAVTPALIRYIYPPERLGQGLGIYALVVGIAFTAGPTVASAVLALANWPWLFLANVPVERAAGDEALLVFLGSPPLPGMDRGRGVRGVLAQGPAGLRQTAGHRLGLVGTRRRHGQGAAGWGEKPGPIPRIAASAGSSGRC